MVRLVTTSPWLWGLLAAVELGGSFARASTVIQGESFVPGVFLVEYEDGVVSFLFFLVVSHLVSMKKSRL